MRWFKPRGGEEKIVKKFAFFPITIHDETRWLETVTIKYRYYTASSYLWDKGCWLPVKFVDKEGGK